MQTIQLENWILTGENGERIETTVPSDIFGELYSAGITDDPLYGDNLEKIRPLFDKTWKYTAFFDLSEELIGSERAILVFDGIDTVSEITLNGESLGRTNNVFLRYEFEVKSLIKSKGNVLEVKILPATKYVEEKGYNYRTLFGQNRLALRKAQCQFGWDWAPVCPTAGIWLPCRLEFCDEIRMEDVRVKSHISGDVSIFVTLDKKGGKVYSGEDKYLLEITVNGEKKTYAVTQHLSLVNFKINNPELWYPNGYGEQKLYDYEVKLFKNGVQTGEKRGKFGIKEIKLERLPYGTDNYSFAIVVNGVKIFAKGSNFVPVTALLGSAKSETYKKLIAFAKEANYNILRVWGGGIYEKDEFYDLCDENGILVWQDFAFACSEIPRERDFVENVYKEAEYQLKRLRNHPSLALLCGGNEMVEWNSNLDLLRYGLRGYCSALVPEIPYIYDSPDSVIDNIWVQTTGDVHDGSLEKFLAADDVKNFRKYVSSGEQTFVSECVDMGSSRIRSLRKFAPEEEIKKLGKILNYHFVDNPYLPRCETFLDKEKKISREMFGEFKDERDFVKKSMISQGEIIRAEIDQARARGFCNGFMNWMYNDTWGCGTWATVDYYLEKKPIYYYQKRAYKSINAVITSVNGKIYAAVVNDTEETLKGVLKVTGKTLDGKIAYETESEITADRGSPATVELKNTDGADYIVAEFYDGKERRESDPYFINDWNFDFATDMETSVRKTEKDGKYLYRIEITARKYARAVFIDTKDNAGVDFGDNFFDIEAGKTKTVQAVSERELGDGEITIKTFADEWED